MRAKLIGGPLHGQSRYVPVHRPGAMQSACAFLRHGDTLYVERMWMTGDGRPVLILVDASLDLGEAFHLGLQVMDGLAVETEGVAS